MVASTPPSFNLSRTVVFRSKSFALVLAQMVRNSNYSTLSLLALMLVCASSASLTEGALCTTMRGQALIVATQPPALVACWPAPTSKSIMPPHSHQNEPKGKE